jgi:hypothetical protein
MFRITTFHSLNEFFTLLPALPIKPNWIQWTFPTAFTLKNSPSLGRHAHSPTARCLDNQQRTLNASLSLEKGKDLILRNIVAIAAELPNGDRTIRHFYTGEYFLATVRSGRTLKISLTLKYKYLEQLEQIYSPTAL